MAKKRTINGSKSRLTSNMTAVAKSKSNGHPVRRLTTNEVVEMVRNESTQMRQWFFKNFLDPDRRDLDKECGYPSAVQIEQYRQMYDREGIGTRVVDVWPDECWKNNPEVYENESEDDITPFEQDWKNLSKELNLYHFLHRIDRVSGIGFCGILLLGLDDGKKFSEPVSGLDEKGRKTKSTKKHKLNYVRCFDESQIIVAEYEGDESNPRYGQPKRYNLKLFDPRTSPTTGAASVTDATVHWTRVIHVADNRTTSEVWGVPRMRPVWNRLVDLRKLCGSAPEMFYKGAFPGLSAEVDPKLADIEMDADAVRNEIRNYQDGLERIVAVQGLSIKQLAVQVADPLPHFDMLITAICIQMGIPKRIFTGSERGELASSQDKGNWNGRVAGRQLNYVTPYVIRPFVDRLIALNVISTPKADYSVDWPDLNIPSDSDKAAVCLQRTQALVQYIQGGGNLVVAEPSYLSKFQGFTAEEAAAMMDEAETNMDDAVSKHEILNPPKDMTSPAAEEDQPVAAEAHDS